MVNGEIHKDPNAIATQREERVFFFFFFFFFKRMSENAGVVRL